MGRGESGGLYGEAARFSAESDGGRVLEALVSRLRRLGATHVLITGLPLPRRGMAKLVVRIDWPDLRSGGHLLDVAASDPLLSCCLAKDRPFVLRGGMLHPLSSDDAPPPSSALAGSDLLAAAGGATASLVVVPMREPRPWQGCVVLAGGALAITPEALDELSYFCKAALQGLARVGWLERCRPGDLSDRERHVLALTAIGKTAGEIAELLAISQRTVHAHLQNAADKMNASNKTHTVIEALRHGQITL